MAKAKGGARSRRQKESLEATELLVLELQQINSAERQLAAMLPRVARSVESEKLGEMLQRRQDQGGRLLNALEGAFEELEESPGRTRNAAAEGLLSDVREHVQEIEEGPALDAVLLAGVQKLEHYCIAAWGTARSLASALGQKQAMQAMEEALKEGKDLDQELTRLAEEEITPSLLSGEQGEEEGEQDETAGQRPTRKGEGGRERRPTQ